MAKTKERSLPQQVDDLSKLRDEIRGLDKQVNELKAQYRETESGILEAMLRDGATKLSGKAATASISENEVPSVEDWDEFHKFIKRNNAFYLLQRRANAAPYRELLQQRRGKKIPGVATVTQRTLNLRAL